VEEISTNNVEQRTGCEAILKLVFSMGANKKNKKTGRVFKLLTKPPRLPVWKIFQLHTHLLKL
jgi:hypothetical protein